MVTIIDPHLKRDDSYAVYRDANEHDGYFVKNKDGNTYDGWCWPGMCIYSLYIYIFVTLVIAVVHKVHIKKEISINQ